MNFLYSEAKAVAYTKILSTYHPPFRYLESTTISFDGRYFTLEI